MPSRISIMAMIASISIIGIGAYNVAIDELDTAAVNSDAFPTITAVAEPSLQVAPLVVFAILGITLFAALRRLPT